MPAPLGSIPEWIEKGPAWAVATLKILAEERRMRDLEHACERGYRKKFLEWDALPDKLRK